jgi:halimadienyl-diphosphate synthase
MTQVFTDLLTRIRNNPNYISPSTYDTAWLAWLYPQAREWVINAQRPDGSWGAEVEYYHDRVITTLAAINAIAASSANSHELKRIEQSIRYLERAIPCLPQDVYETVGFELLVPNLVNVGKSLGLKLDQVERLIEPLMPIYHQKLALIPKDLIYSPKVAVAHSLEFMDFKALDQAAIPHLRSINGSIHNSPSATAFVEIAMKGSREGRAYLDMLLSRYSGVAPGFAPFELFELIWVLYHISLNSDLRLLRPTIDPFVEFLNNVWTEKGVGFSVTFIPDPDDASLAFRIMSKLGLQQDPSFLEVYEVNDHFQCFPLERNLSLDVHIHIVDALRDTPDFPRRDDLLLKALNILGRDLTTEYIVDKWHISPYYSTSHAIIALTGLSDNIIKKQIKWLLKTQREDGSWTFYPNQPRAAVEETAYALMALMTVYEVKGNIPFDVIQRGFRYLEKHYRTAEDLPALWINKVLYNPYHIVDAVILSTLTKYQNL